MESSHSSSRFSSRRMRYAVLVCLGSSLAACGGGSSSPGSSTAQTGVLLDSPVEGIAYSTPTHTGTTNARGEFQYEPGESVNFQLGAMNLGSAAGADQVTLFDLAGVTQVPTDAGALSSALSNAAEHRPLHRAINMAILLQSLDDDGVAENGLRIPAPVAARFDADTLWLDQPYGRFAANHRLRQILRNAADANQLSPRGVVAAGDAMAHLMQSADLTQVTYLARRMEKDTDGMSGAESAWDRTYNARGQQLTHDNDTNGDGVTDNSNLYTYNAAGQYTVIAHDDDGNGSADYTQSYTYNNFGEEIREEHTDGAGQTLYLETQTYDANGVLVGRQTTSGSSQKNYRWFADDSGTRTAYEIDNDGDGTWDRHDDLVYDAQDRWIERDIDFDNDGTVDAYWERSWDALGSMTAQRKDNDNDGTFDEVETWTYNTNGQRTEYLRTFPSSTDQSNARRATTTYDAQNRQVSYVIDFGNDGTNDSITRHTYSDNEDGTHNHVTDYDSNADDVVERRVERLHRADGKTLRNVETRNMDTNSPTVTTTTYSYDELGRLVQRQSDDETVTFSDWVAIPLGRVL